MLIRVRPLIDNEKGDWTCINISGNNIRLKEQTDNQLLDQYATEYSFNFDRVCGPDSTQSQIFDSAQLLADSFLQGYNASVLAYGLTSSGKTYTMFNGDGNYGIVYRIAEYIFGKMDTSDPDACLSFSFIQIYNEQVSDLLHPEQQLKIKMGNDRATVEGCSVYVVKQLEDIQQLINEGEQSRKTGQTKYNELSSRSHVIATLYLSTSKYQSKMHLVDLAGSERLSVKLSSVQGQETKHINASLAALNKVISALSARQSFIPYRES